MSNVFIRAVLLSIALLCYACEATARGRGCGPEGCGALAGVISGAVVLCWIYWISKGSKIPWLGLVPHLIIIAGTLYASASAKGEGAAIAALIIMITVIHGGFKISNTKTEE